jgi:tetratricopeptide (TPR) repeat protein
VIRLHPDSHAALNSLAWELALTPDPPARESDEALVYARKSMALTPNDANHWNTLALAEYRARHWNDSIAAAQRSIALANGGSALDWFFLAMAHAQKNEKVEALKWFDKAVAQTKEKDPKNTELLQFWNESAALIGQPGPGAPEPAASTPPTAKRAN